MSNNNYNKHNHNSHNNYNKHNKHNIQNTYNKQNNKQNNKQSVQNKHNVQNKYNNNDEGFMNLDSFQSIKIIEEIDLIDNTLSQLYEQMDRYLDDAKSIWDDHIRKFINSTDCNTLHYLTEYDSDKFLKFMATQ